jgi:hypothetical protein
MSDRITGEEMANHLDLRELYQSAASALVWPEKVVIRWQDPANYCATGTVSKNLAGVYFMDISQSIPVVQTYDVFLHECGHILSDGGTINKSNYPNLVAASYTLAAPEQAKRSADPGVAGRERRADLYAIKLAKIAEDNMVDHYEYDEPTLFARLKALIAIGRQSL